METIVLPGPVEEFLFDLHQACRHSLRIDEVQPLYEEKFIELSEKYFSHDNWPESKHISMICGHDKEFLLFYKEMTLRHLFTRSHYRPKLNDHIEAWNNYTQVRAFNIYNFIIFNIV